MKTKQGNNHVKSDIEPGVQKNLLQALRSARKYRADGEQRLRDVFEKKLEMYVNLYLSEINLSHRIVDAVYSGDSALRVRLPEVDKFFSKTFNKTAYEMCSVSDDELYLDFDYSLEGFYSQVLKTVAIDELRTSTIELDNGPEISVTEIDSYWQSRRPPTIALRESVVHLNLKWLGE